MKFNRTTKSALFTSVVSLFLCFTMLLGTTFAWFTDSATSANNKIVAGTLDVQLWMHNGTEYVNIGDNATPIFGEASGLAQNNAKDTLWEPGKTQVVYLKIVNNGTLDLKYSVAINVRDNADDKDLYKVLEYAITPNAEPDDVASWDATKGTKVNVGNNVATSNNVTMTAGAEHYFALSVHMLEEAGNEYQGGYVEFDIKVAATQVDTEADSFGTDYDKEADFIAEVTNANELATALKFGGIVKFANDIVADQTLEIPAGAVVELDLNGKTITGDATFATIRNEGTVTIKGGTLKNTGINGKECIHNVGTMVLDDVAIVGAPIGATGYPAYAVSNEGKLTIEDGTSIVSDRGAIRIASGGDVTINGGEFVVTDAADGRNMTLHTIYANGNGATLTINGGTFVQNHSSTGGASVICPAGATINIYGGNFSDKMDDSSWKNTGNFQNYMGYSAPVNVYGGIYNDKTVSKWLADGFKAVDNGDGTYMVIPNDLSTVEGYPQLYTDGKNGYYVYDAQGLISLNNWINMSNSNGKTFNVMADINASGYTWNCKMVSPDGDNTPGLIFNGNGHTISNLTIAGGGLFTLAPNGTNATEPATFKDITFDNVTVTGDYHVGVVWGQLSGDLVLNNVHVKNSNLTGTYNVGGLIGSTGEFAIDANAKYIDCSVTNTTLTANGAAGGDPTGASAFIGRALGKTNLVFEGNNVAENITYVNENGLVGGGIYGYSTWAGGFVGTGVCDNFTNWSGVTYHKVANGLYQDEKSNYYIYNADGLMAFHDDLAGTYDCEKVAGKTVNIMADIDATGKTWITLKMNSGANNSKGFTFNGNGHTISNLTIQGETNEGTGLFTMNSGSAENPTTFNDLIIDKAVVNGVDYHTGTIWGQVTGNGHIVLNKVSVINSQVSGGCNVGGLIGRNSESHAVFTFKDCAVKNTTVKATKLGDYSGASAFLGTALRVLNNCSAKVVFEGTNVAEGNTLISAEGMQGGGIYTTAAWDTASWNTPIVVNDFTNYNSND